MPQPKVVGSTKKEHAASTQQHTQPAWARAIERTQPQDTKETNLESPMNPIRHKGKTKNKPHPHPPKKEGHELKSLIRNTGLRPTELKPGKIVQTHRVIHRPGSPEKNLETTQNQRTQQKSKQRATHRTTDPPGEIPEGQSVMND